MELKRLLKHIADAIREKTGASDTIVAADFPANIAAIPIEPKGMHTITLSASDPAGGTVSGGGLASEGMTVTVKAEAAEGYRFAGWYKGSAHQLPPGYTELEYIRSNGAQYIDTGFTPNQDTRTVVSCKLPAPESGPSQHMFSSRRSVEARAFAFYGYEGNYRSVYGTSNQLANSGEIDGPFQVDFDKNVLKIDGVVKITHSKQDFVCPGPLYLFAGNNNGTTVNYAAAYLYSCKIYDNGTLVRDYVPCAAPDGAVGLYDLVGGSFYGSAGTGTFEAGPKLRVSGDTEYAFSVGGDLDLEAMFDKVQ